MHTKVRCGVTGWLSIASLALAGAGVLAGCGPDPKMRPELFLSLGDSCNTPDGLTLCEKTNTMYLCCPNFNDQKHPGIVMKIDAANKATKFCDLPSHPQTKKVGPMGLDIGPDGHLYVADNQYFFDKDHKSRLLRVKVKDGKPAGADVVVDGFKLANAVIWRGDSVYVSDTFFDLKDKPGASGVYRFKLSEFAKGPIFLKPNATDPHLIATFTTIPNHRKDPAGADGLTFDSEGTLYCGNFGDGVISKISFNKDGSVAANEILVKSRKLTCADGMFYDKKRNLIYVADSEKNAIWSITPEGKLSLVWMNSGETDGSDGLLDQPCEVLVRGDEMYIVCFDMSFPGLRNRKYDEHHTLSVIHLGE